MLLLSAGLVSLFAETTGPPAQHNFHRIWILLPGGGLEPMYYEQIWMWNG